MISTNTIQSGILSAILTTEISVLDFATLNKRRDNELNNNRYIL